MSMKTSIAAFASRGLRGPGLWSYGVHGGLLAAGILIAAAATAAQVEPGDAARLGLSWLGIADVLAVETLVLGLLVVAPAWVTASVIGERNKQTLDQLRVTPQAPLELVGGILLGLPARLYLVLGGPLLVHLACGLCGVVAPRTLVASLLVLVVGGLVANLLGLMVALGPSREAGGGLSTALVAVSAWISTWTAAGLADVPSLSPWAFLHPAGSLHAALVSSDGVWRRLLNRGSWQLERFAEPAFSGTLELSPVLSCLLGLVLIGFLGRAACRKLAAPERALFGKREALALFAVLSMSILAPVLALPEPSAEPESVFLFAVLVLPVAVALGMAVSPPREAWVRRLRRGGAASAWDEDAPPHLMFWAMLAVFGGLSLLCLRPFEFPAGLSGDDRFGLGYAAVIALTIPVHLHFALTRYPSGGARAGFTVASLVYFLCQVIAVALWCSHEPSVGNRTATIFVELAAVAAVAVPGWLLWRQRVLSRRLLAE